MAEAARPWVRLDNAAKIFPSVTSDRLTHLFRLSVRLDSPVKPELLKKALHGVLPRFPSFRFRLKAGFFWYSLVEDSALPEVFPESMSPCLPFRKRVRGLFRVRWFGRRIAVEFSHALTDGVGAMTFLRAFVAEYLHQDGTGSDDPEDIRRVRGIPDATEGLDDFQTLYDASFPRYQTWDRAFQVPSSLLPRGRYAVLTGHLPLEATLTLARNKRASLTEKEASSVAMAMSQAQARPTPPPSAAPWMRASVGFGQLAMRQSMAAKRRASSRFHSSEAVLARCIHCRSAPALK